MRLRCSNAQHSTKQVIKNAKVPSRVCSTWLPPHPFPADEDPLELLVLPASPLRRRCPCSAFGSGKAGDVAELLSWLACKNSGVENSELAVGPDFRLHLQYL